MSWTINNLYISKLFLYIITMKELSVTEAREQVPALLNQAAKKPVWITRHGVDVAVVISPELFEELVSAQEELEDIAAVDEAMLDKSPKIPWAQVKKDLKLDWLNMKLYFHLKQKNLWKHYPKSYKLGSTELSQL